VKLVGRNPEATFIRCAGPRAAHEVDVRPAIGDALFEDRGGVGAPAGTGMNILRPRPGVARTDLFILASQ
jgi:hypothetical protein